MIGEDILVMHMQKNDAGAATIRDYLKALLFTLWREGESFSGKRPFGNSDWEAELYETLETAGIKDDAVDEAICLAIGAL